MLGAFFAAALVYALYRNVFIDYETVHNIVRGTQESLSLAGTFHLSSSKFKHWWRLCCGIRDYCNSYGINYGIN